MIYMFTEFWELHFGCKYPGSAVTLYNEKYSNECTGKERLTRENTRFEGQLQFVSDATMALAEALKDMHRILCKGQDGLCQDMIPVQGNLLLAYLRNVSFTGMYYIM